VALVPLTLLGLAILGASGSKDVWRDQLAPPVRHRFTAPTYHAINAAVEKILHHGTLGLLLFAAVLSAWNLSSVVRACMGALDAIYEQDDERPARYRFPLSVAIGIAIGVCVIAAVLAVTAGRHLGGGNSAVEALLLVVRWIFTLAVLALTVALLVTFAPARRRAERWVGVGTLVVVVGWVLMSLVFGWFVASLANFKTAAGQLTVFLVLTSYAYASAIVFLVGVQLDELLRTQDPHAGRGLAGRLHRLTGG
jgi:membrane protein